MKNYLLKNKRLKIVLKKLKHAPIVIVEEKMLQSK